MRKTLTTHRFSCFLSCKAWRKLNQKSRNAFVANLVLLPRIQPQIINFLPSQHKREYQEILDAVNGSDKEKKLAAQFIAKFFKCFPDLMETSLDRQLDLCEDEDVQVKNLKSKCWTEVLTSFTLGASTRHQGIANFL
jgi:Apoptosis inhibitory protein 5 (API5)